MHKSFRKTFSQHNNCRISFFKYRDSIQKKKELTEIRNEKNLFLYEEKSCQFCLELHYIFIFHYKSDISEKKLNNDNHILKIFRKITL